MPFSSEEPPLFDPLAIEKLRKVAAGLDPDFVSEMSQLFLVETRKALIELGSASERADAHALTRVAHSLKSSAATLGMMRLSKACLALELDTKSGVLGPGTGVLVQAVLDRFDEATPVLKQLS